MARFCKSAGLAIAAVALLAAAPAPAAQAAPRASVLVVGDSLEELSSQYLANYLPGVELTVNAVGGTNTYEILELFEESYDPSQNVIVFDGGTNDNPNYPQILEENLAKVAAQVGDRCMVVPTIHGYTVEGANNRGKNSVVHRFAASRPGTQTPDYASLVNRNPGLLQSDNLHPTEEGSERRAELIARGILGCIAYAESAGLAAAPEATASAVAVQTTRLDPVGKLALREKAIYRSLASGVIREAAMLAVLRSLLPLG
jgi:lysophospholipase L1-like esterase